MDVSCRFEAAYMAESKRIRQEHPGEAARLLSGVFPSYGVLCPPQQFLYVQIRLLRQKLGENAVERAVGDARRTRPICGGLQRSVFFTTWLFVVAPK